jgi:hypothetical protein
MIDRRHLRRGVSVVEAPPDHAGCHREGLFHTAPPGRVTKSRRVANQKSPRSRMFIPSERRAENESSATKTVDHRRLVGRIDLAAQPTHMNVHLIGFRNKFVIPDVPEQNRSGDPLAIPDVRAILPQVRKVPLPPIQKRALGNFAGWWLQARIAGQHRRCGLVG